MDLLENLFHLKYIQTLSLKRLHLEGQELRFLERLTHIHQYYSTIANCELEFVR